MTTLVVIRHAQVGSQHFHHGEELPPGLVPREIVDHWLDERRLKEYDSKERPSLYRLFARFTGYKEEQPLTQEQIARYALEE